MVPLVNLQHHLRSLGRVLLGYSGGVDSAVLAVTASKALDTYGFLAVIGKSPSYPEEQYRVAWDIARRYGFSVLEVGTNELADPDYRANPTNRCFFCKRELWRQLRLIAAERGFDSIIDGTNVDDLQDHRPGAAAGTDASIGSPLAELGWTKEMVRQAARDLELPIWDAPASPCLASRVRYGVAVTEERLRQVEQAEAFLRTLGVEGDLRVRHLGAGARIEVLPEALGIVEDHWAMILPTFEQLGFGSVVLDPDGYRRGSLLAMVEG